MSLFDIIKYKHVDLSSKDVLEELPAELILIYWQNSSLSKMEGELDRCSVLALWYRIYPSILNELYLKSLKEYCNANI